MRRSRWDLVWFAAAVGLLMAGIVGWWRAGVGAAAGDPTGRLLIAVWAAAAIILCTAWRRGASPDSYDARLMAPLALAASAPLAVLSLWMLSPTWAAIAGLMAGVAGVPLALALTRDLPDQLQRRRARGVAVGASIAAVLFGLAPLGESFLDDAWGVARWVCASVVVLVPAAMLAGATLQRRAAIDASAADRIPTSVAVVMIGAAPAVTGLCLLLDGWVILVLPAIAVMLTLLLIGRFALRPLEGLVDDALSQRDRAVTGADAERARLASVIHDGPLAEVAILIQRLDDQGDAASASIARSIAAELRAIGSELRLPILDDLGVGPALAWLVRRLAGRSGTPISLDQRTDARPPAEIEFAMYRVAQEALVNAVKHAVPPIVVGYRATSDGAEVWVDDAGPGIPQDAIARAEREGRLGLASMAQRAEATGSRLTVAARPDGGTRVSLVWRMPAAVPTSTLVDARGVAGNMGAARTGP